MPAGEQPPGDGSALDRMANLPERGKEPASARILDTWISQAQQKLGMDAGRLGWLIASTVVVAALQRAVDETGRSLFLLKGGTYLQHRMSLAARPTKDVDGLVRGDLDAFLDALDDALRLPWGPLTLTRTEPVVIATPARVLKPRRFDVRVSLRGQVWRRIQVEVAPDEAGAGDEQDVLAGPGLGHFGLPSPEFLLGIALRYQIAQKIHACTAKVGCGHGFLVNGCCHSHSHSHGVWVVRHPRILVVRSPRNLVVTACRRRWLTIPATCRREVDGVMAFGPDELLNAWRVRPD